MRTAIVRQEVRQKLQEIGKADIVVGIPSYNNARTIGHVVRAVQAGLAKYFSGLRAVIVNSDGGSTDGTRDVVNQTSVSDFETLLVPTRLGAAFKIATSYHGIPGKGSAFRTIFEIADALNVTACAVVDSDLRSITPEWLQLLLKPLFAGFDYVAPLYHRHKYDGTITNSIVYPITRALYGKRVRQPIGGDFGFSGKITRFYVAQDVWETDVARYGIDIWMTTSAIANRFNVCQAFLGAKIHDPKDPGSDLSAMLYQVVGAMFELMGTYRVLWETVHGSEQVETFGFHYDVGLEPVNVNVRGMLDKFRLGARELAPIWEEFINRDTVTFLRGLADRSEQDFSIPDEVWAEIVYSFAIGYHKEVLNKEHLLKSLTPLYMGRTASFVLQTRESTVTDVEKKIEELCLTFENKKDFLLHNWG
jgi:glucosylglycerate synthase